MRCACGREVEIKSKGLCKPCNLRQWRKVNGRRKELSDRRVPRYSTQGEMTFREIGERLGTTERAVHMCYMAALRKLRRKPQSLNLLRSLIAEKNKHQPIPIHEQFQNWVTQ